MSRSIPPVPNAQALAYLLSGVMPARSYWDMPVEDARDAFRTECRLGAGEVEPVASIEEVDADGVLARLYRPTGQPSAGVLIWLHGGGWILGDLDCYDSAVRALANRAGCAVLSVDYRRAPEHPHPAAIEDARIALAWAAERFEHVAVGGDSAGGNLAALAAIHARDHGVRLDFQLLVYPVIEYRPDSASYLEFAERYRGFPGRATLGEDSRRGIRHIWEAYVPDARRRHDPLVSPLRTSSHHGLAPALVITAEHDILRAEGEEYAGLLAAAGVPVELVEFEGQVHGFFQLLGAGSDAIDAIERAAESLRHAFLS